LVVYENYKKRVACNMNVYERQVQDVLQIVLEIYLNSADKAMGLMPQSERRSDSQQRSGSQQRSASKQRSESVDRRQGTEDEDTKTQQLTQAAWRRIIFHMGLEGKTTSKQKAILVQLKKSAEIFAGTSNSQAVSRSNSRGRSLNAMARSGPPSRTGSPSTRQPGTSEGGGSATSLRGRGSSLPGSRSSSRQGRT
jgi:hypothetical protein